MFTCCPGGYIIEIINNTRQGIVMFIQAKKGNASNGGQIQVPDAKLRRLTVFFIVYNIFIKKYFYSFNDKMTAKINKDNSL